MSNRRICMGMGKGILLPVRLLQPRAFWATLVAMIVSVGAAAQERWDARWIGPAPTYGNTVATCLFRKSIDVADVPAQFLLRVSADSRYILYVNGCEASRGPSLGDTNNWNYTCVDIAPHLKKGRNVLAAVVWRWADMAPEAQLTGHRLALIVQAADDAGSAANTDSTWICSHDSSRLPYTDFNTVGYYVAGAGESIDGRLCQWGWTTEDYDCSQWAAAHEYDRGADKGARDYAGLQLVQSPIPEMQLTRQPPLATRIAVPAHSRRRLLLDNKVLTTAYPVVVTSGGSDSRIGIGYAEALYLPDSLGRASCWKGNRDSTDGKVFAGNRDLIIADGGQHRTYSTLWWRTYRYIELDVTTGDDPLTIDSIYGIFTAYPFSRDSKFRCDERPELAQMLDVGWRTARLCAHETYMDCPYYEQLQYFGDTRIQCLVSLYNSADARLVRAALEKGRQSIGSDGLTMSRYPSRTPQFISSFSLYWILMAHDYWMMRGDEAFLSTLLPSQRSVLAWYESHMKPDGSLDRVPYWFFLDWAKGLDYGEPPREADGNSSIQDLLYIITLRRAAQMEAAFGLPAMAQHYNEVEMTVRRAFREKYWDDGRGLFADTPERNSFSQHANVLAVLAGMVDKDEARGLMQRVLSDNGLTQCTIYFSYYMGLALSVSGLGDSLADHLQVWRDQMALGLSTWAETPEPSRSDCHAWGASPNVEFFRTMGGISPSAPGFATVRLAPHLGTIKRLSCSVPHPLGAVEADYEVDAQGRLKAAVTLPEGVAGQLEWKGATVQLHGGSNVVVAEPHADGGAL